MCKRINIYSIILMGLTSLHHAYGAWIYNTPWRLHILAISIPVLILNVYALKKEAMGNIFYRIWCGVNFIITTCLIGVYEGIYNHLMKNILYFAGAGTTTMNSLFPPPTYEMPNDFIFEFTGILQALLAIGLLFAFSKLALRKAVQRSLSKGK